jgi:hypothetical protein
VTEELEIHPSRQRGSSQTVIEHGGGADEQRTASRYGRALFVQRIGTLAWWMLPVPVLAGRGLVVALAAFYAWRKLRPLDSADALDAAARAFWCAVAGGAAYVLVFVVGALDRAWYPVWWSWGAGRMPVWLGNWRINLPAWFVWLRAFLIIAPPLAWDASYRFVAWRFVVEIVSPTASSVPVQQARASSVQTPRGAPVRFRDPDDEPAPVIVQQPVRPVPFQANGQLVHDVLTTASGAQIGKDRLLSMLDAQDHGSPAGFSWRTWHRRGWSRTEWEAALELLGEMQLITAPKPGQTTALQVPVDIAEDAVSRLV